MLDISHNSTLLIDSNAYMYRFFYGSDQRVDPNNNAVNVVYAFMGYARRLLQQYKPKRLIFVFDADGNNFRHDRPAHAARSGCGQQNVGIAVRIQASEKHRASVALCETCARLCLRSARWINTLTGIGLGKSL